MVGDSFNNLIRSISLPGGAVRTLAGGSSFLVQGVAGAGSSAAAAAAAAAAASNAAASAVTIGAVIGIAVGVSAAFLALGGLGVVLYMRKSNAHAGAKLFANSARTSANPAASFA